MAHLPKPTALKLIQGTQRKDRAQPNEPTPVVAIPKCPAHLTPKAKTVWKSLVKHLETMGVMTLPDGLALEQLCSAYAEWRDLVKLIEVDGYTYKTNGAGGEMLIKGNPAVAMASDAQKRIRGMLQEFGLTPSSRTKVNAEPQHKIDPLEEYLNRRK